MNVACLCPNCDSEIRVPSHEIWDHTVESVTCITCGIQLTTHLPIVAEEFSDATEAKREELPRPFEKRGWKSLGVLGRGGMGVVYTIMRESSRQLRAVKVLPPECTKYPELIDRFHLETRSLASLNHPNIVGIQEIGTADGLLYFVMDFISGVNLKDILYQKKQLLIEEILTIGTAVAEAVQCCHDHGMVHRDLKPANIMLSQSGSIKVMDFGIANFLINLGDKTDHGVQIGTPQYISPEQTENGSSVDERGDQYSLAVMLYEMMTGHLPKGIFERPSENRPDINSQVDQAIYKALDFYREKRYNSIRSFMRAVRKGQKAALPTHKGEMMIRKLSMELMSTSRAPLDHNTPKVRRDSSIFSLSHPARDVLSEEDVEEILEEADSSVDFEETPKSIRLDRYQAQDTPLSPRWKGTGE